MIRFIFVALFLFLYLILGIPVYLILRLVCKINKKPGTTLPCDWFSGHSA